MSDHKEDRPHFEPNSKEDDEWRKRFIFRPVGGAIILLLICAAIAVTFFADDSVKFW